ncbi:sigma-54 dependent transcriptional regulator [Chitinispirillales bacterium ANBcel5]|uniref:sigma-54-dependent transcriptional regulator n=1 Tax=Cellulosispirillum alkaliphilum TaxID=3039283 RepID=UPI002A55D2E9|nr:sigma-54 dependent transcriptional regulator [Chitinispirillales bacterium ANBcel5]
MKILVVDDNELFRDSIVETLRRQEYQVIDAPDGISALTLFSEQEFDLVISDMKMPGMSGMELLENVKKIKDDVPFLIITAYGAIDTAVEAIKKGAFDFIQKTDSLIRELELTVERTLKFRTLVKENYRLKKEIKNKWSYIGNVASITKIKELTKAVAESRSTVLVTGESGTGKELVARSIHYQSPRSQKPFVKINCAALPEGLIESELFGHEKGAFTGAINRKAGKFESASGGTLLLDEIGEMPLTAQAKLLRVLQEKEIQKVGGDDTIEIDVRIVATTNRDLEELVSKGTFREDLFYRLNVFHIHLPPLRERKEDVEELVRHFITKYNDENGFSVEGFEKECIKHLHSYTWPGNIRELENTVERAVVLTRTGLIAPDVFDIKSGNLNGSKINNLEVGMTIADAERNLILKTLDACNQNRTKAAQLLGISIRTLRNKLNEYALETNSVSES